MIPKSHRRRQGHSVDFTFVSFYLLQFVFPFSFFPLARTLQTPKLKKGETRRHKSERIMIKTIINILGPNPG